ncbi:transposase [Stappia sp.]|uniref:transposase n=1 Tax=Stappia sp. TaxID=1870903 RepID=UPI003C7AE934
MTVIAFAEPLRREEHLLNIPPRKTRKWKNCFSSYLYICRNVIERIFGRLEEFRRIATRYARNAVNFLSALCLAATICYWL